MNYKWHSVGIKNIFKEENTRLQNISYKICS